MSLVGAGCVVGFGQAVSQDARLARGPHGVGAVLLFMMMVCQLALGFLLSNSKERGEWVARSHTWLGRSLWIGGALLVVHVINEISLGYVSMAIALATFVAYFMGVQLLGKVKARSETASDGTDVPPPIPSRPVPKVLDLETVELDRDTPQTTTSNKKPLEFKPPATVPEEEEDEE
jgi:uncharacterized membrane protein